MALSPFAVHMQTSIHIDRPLEEETRQLAPCAI